MRRCRCRWVSSAASKKTRRQARSIRESPTTTKPSFFSARSTRRCMPPWPAAPSAPGLAMTSTVDYAPKYFLVNGQAEYTMTGVVPTIAVGSRVLVRFLNAGLLTRIPELLGASMTLLSEDGNLSPYPTGKKGFDWPACGKDHGCGDNAGNRRSHDVAFRPQGVREPGHGKRGRNLDRSGDFRSARLRRPPGPPCKVKAAVGVAAAVGAAALSIPC